MKVKNKLKPLTIEFCKRFLVCKMGSAKGHLMFAKKRNGESFTALDYWDKLHLMIGQDLVTMLTGGGKKVDVMEKAWYKSVLTPVKKFILNAFKNKNKKNTFDLWTIGDDEAKNIRRFISLNLKGYKHQLVDSDIRHIRNTHGVNAKKLGENEVGLTDDDICDIPNILANPDNVTVGSMSKKGDVTIKFEKIKNDGTVTIVEVVKENKTLQVKTMWKNNKHAGVNAGKANAGNTSKNAGNNSSTIANILQQKGADVNNIFEQAAFHGSGKSFSEFDLGYLGTGEGAQAHGWGLYFAKDRKVAAGYRNALNRANVIYKIGNNEYTIDKSDRFTVLDKNGNRVDFYKHLAVRAIFQNNDSVKEALKELSQKALEWGKSKYPETKKDAKEFKKAIKWLEKQNKFEVVNNNGGLYEVEIPDDDVLLDEQKDLTEQPEKVQEAIRNIIADLESGKIGTDADNFTKLSALKIMKEKCEWGGEFYSALSKILGSDRAASELLNKYGIKGITYEGNQDGRCFVVFDDKAVEIINVFNQENGKATQAQSAFLGNNVANVERFVNLLKDADITTFFHEAGHIFFVDLMMLGQNPLATEQMKRDWETVLKWTEWDENQLKEYENTAAYGQMAEIDREIREAMGTPQPQAAAPLTGGKRLEAALNRWRQERWARAVEDYCIKGDVPSEGLRKALSNIKKWLVKVYRMLRGAGVPMSKEVKDVMDRMLASKEAVELAAAKAGLEDFRRQGGLDMASDSAKDMWLKLYDEAKERAEAKVRALAMGDLEEERQVQMEEARARERERATKMFQNTRHFRAKAYLDATPNIDRNLVLAKFSLTPEEYERDVANDGGSVENAVAKYMKDVYEPVLQKEFYVTQAQMQKKAEEALQEPKYRAVVTAFEGEILESYNKRFHRLSAKLEKEEAERVRQKREAQAAVVKQNIQNLLDTLTPARVRGMAEDANIPEDLDKIPKEGLLDRVKNWLKNIIGKNITDPLGNKVHFALKEGETEEDYALHLLAGKDNAGVEDVERRRAIGVMLAERTIKRPWAVVTQENGRKLYMSIYKGRSGNIAEQVVVAVEDGEDGVVITSFPTMDRGLKNTALKEFKRRVSNAKAVDYLGTPAMGYSREARNKQTSNGSTPYSAVAKNSIADLDIDVNNLTPQEKRARREELHKETIRQLKEELKSAKQATRRAALEVVRNCRKYAARRMEDLPVSESGDFCKKNFSKSS